MVLFAACAEEDLSASLRGQNVLGVGDNLFALVTVLSVLFGDGYARLISLATEVETEFFLLEQAETPLSVYQVRLELALAMIMFKYHAVCSVEIHRDRLQVAWPGADAWREAARCR